jgi:hypothetical protein
MTVTDVKTDLLDYLQDAREVLLWKLDGLWEYDIRRPLVATGTNLLGLVKHLAAGELGYFGDTFGRPCPASRPGMNPMLTPTSRSVTRRDGAATGTGSNALPAKRENDQQ